MSERKTILHIITSLERSESATMLRGALKEDRSDLWKHVVVSFGDEERWEGVDASETVEFHALRMTAWWRVPMGLWKLLRLMLRTRPQLVETRLGRAILVGSLMSRCVLPLTPVVWGIQGAPIGLRRDSRWGRLAGRLLAHLSKRVPKRILLDSAWALETHVACGYPRRKLELLRMGVDTESFKPDPETEAATRQRLHIPEAAPILGVMLPQGEARPSDLVIRALFQLQSRFPEVHYLLVGGKQELSWAHHAPRPKQFIVCPMERRRAAYSMMHLVTPGACFPHSRMELMEAMASGIPVVTVDGADATALVGDAGRVLSLLDTEHLALAWEMALRLESEERLERSHKARQRMQQLHSMAHLAKHLSQLYASLARPIQPTPAWITKLRALFPKREEPMQDSVLKVAAQTGKVCVLEEISS